MEKKITVDADYGDEIVIQCGDRFLKIVVDEKELLPDFYAALTRAVNYDPLLVLRAAERAYHHQIGSDSQNRYVFGGLRDKMFADIKANAKSTANKPEQTTAPTVEEPAPAEIEQTPKKKSKRG